GPGSQRGEGEDKGEESGDGSQEVEVGAGWYPGRIEFFAGQMDDFKRPRPFERAVPDKGEMFQPEKAGEAEAPSIGLLPGSEPAAPVAEIVDRIGVMRVEARQRGHFPGNLLAFLQFDDV